MHGQSPRYAAAPEEGQFIDPRPPRAGAKGIVFGTYVVFFLSGAAALIYEMSWARQIGLLFGHTVHAGAVVLAAFFAGMAAGNALGGRWSSRVSPLTGYAVAELAAAGWALLIPTGLKLAETGDVVRLLWHSAPAVQTTLRVTLTFGLLFPATTALGATLPFIAEFLSPARRPADARVSLAYALNTAGAVAGVVTATSVLLLVVGVRASGYLAAGIGALCGLAALVARAKSPDSGVQGPELTAKNTDSGLSTPDSQPSHPLLLAAVSGFTLLALEVLYMRLFSLVFHNSSYTFGAVVAVFLAGLALGAMAVSWLTRSFTARQLVVAGAGLGALATPASVLLFLYFTGLRYFELGDSFVGYITAVFVLVALVVLTPVGLFGMLLPTLWQVARLESTGSGAVVGRLTAVNTLAAASGSLAASLFLLPILGLWTSFALLAVLPAVFAAVLYGTFSWTTLGTGTIAGVLALAATIVPPQVRQGLLDSQRQLLAQWESAYGRTEVVQNSNDGSVQLLQNLHYGLGTVGRSTPHYRQGQMPILLHKNPNDTLFLGLGTGMTAGAAIPHREVETIVVVELVPEVVRAARRLSEWNNGVVDDSKVEIRIGDARHYLLGTRRRFDVIVSDLFVPWQSQTGYLYTVEHYRAVRRRLKPGGLFCQWMPLYQMGAKELDLIADSFASVFPHTTLWWGLLNGESAILGLVGSEQPLVLDAVAINERFEALRRAPGKTDDYIASARDLFFLYAGQWPAPPSHGLNTDEHPRVEFLAPLAHRNRRLLQGETLLNYYDRVLAELPGGDVLFQPAEGEGLTAGPREPKLNPSPGSNPSNLDPMLRDRRNWHRWILFPSAEVKKR